MRQRARAVVPLVLITGLIATAPAGADDGIAVGVRAGFLATSRVESLNQYEVYATFGLPWRWRWGSGWTLGTRVNASLGALKGGGDTSFLGMLGPGIVLGREGSGWSLDGGVGIALLSRDEFGRFDLGGEFQFNNHIGVSYRFGWGLELGYRFMHISNASLEDPNPGLDMHLFELGYAL